MLPLLLIKMPLYEYQCIKCGHKFTVWQKIGDPPIERCPRCRGRVERIISPNLGIIFKGSGFYVTDYKYKEQQPKDKKERENKE